MNSLNLSFFYTGDGRNNIILNLNSTLDLRQLHLDSMKAILIQTLSSSFTYQANFDLTIPSLDHVHSLSQIESSVLFSPARRKYFLSFLGRIPSSSESKANNTILSRIKSVQLNLQMSKTNSALHNEFLFDFDCDEKTRRLCDNQTFILNDSTFTFVMPPQATNKDDSVLFDHQTSTRLFNALSTGTIPVIVGGDSLVLPLEEAIDWNRAVIRIPVARITEVYLVLKTFTDSDLIAMRRAGSLIYRNYFRSVNNTIASVIAFVRHIRLQIPAPPARNEYSTYHYAGMQNQSDPQGTALTEDLDREENLGPLEPAFASSSYRRNYSITFAESYDQWNSFHLSPFTMFPSLPFDPVMPSEAKFMGSSYGFRPINGGEGGSGKEFSEAIGGNVAREQFTIVIPTFERIKVLLQRLETLKVSFVEQRRNWS